MFLTTAEQEGLAERCLGPCRIQMRYRTTGPDL